jgi:cytochrome d ubiquinol oxidase subunit II
MDPLNHVQSIVTFAWWMVLALSVLLYIVLDGADLGAGVFSLFVRKSNERGAIMASMAGTWDANETWLVVGGGVLFGTFPFVYGSLFSYLMVPLALALWGIITRAVALEFRHLHDPRGQHFAEYAFGISSLVVVFFGGMAFGAVLQGFPMTHPSDALPTYVGGALRFISPFSVWTGVAAVLAVLMAGVLYVRWRFEHDEPVRHQAERWADVLFPLNLGVVVVTLVFSASIFPWASGKWFGPHWWVWALALLAVVVSAFKMRAAFKAHHDFVAILWLNLAIAIMAIGLMATVYPWLVPNTWTLYDGVTPAVSLFTFTLTMGGFIPVMLMYNAYQFWVFRARISSVAAYH